MHLWITLEGFFWLENIKNAFWCDNSCMQEWSIVRQGVILIFDVFMNKVEVQHEACIEGEITRVSA